MDNLVDTARKEAKDVNLKAFEDAQKIVTDKVKTDYDASAEKAALVAQKGVVTALDTKIKGFQTALTTLKATAKSALDASNAAPGDSGLKTASDNAAAAVTTKEGEITTEVGKMRTERTKEKNLKAAAETKFNTLAETADKDNFDTAKEELFGTTGNRASGAEAKMNKALKEYNDLLVKANDKEIEIQDNIYTFFDPNPAIAKPNGKTLDDTEKAKAERLVNELLTTITA